jgi:hypothetical protein
MGAPGSGYRFGATLTACSIRATPPNPALYPRRHHPKVDRPAGITSATLGSRSRSEIAHCNCADARPRLMFNVAEISATTLTCPSMAQLIRTT